MHQQLAKLIYDSLEMQKWEHAYSRNTNTLNCLKIKHIKERSVIVLQIMSALIINKCEIGNRPYFKDYNIYLNYARRYSSILIEW